MIPPEASNEFVANMENVLATYAQPYDERFPVVCMDEQPVQLTKETRTPIGSTTITSGLARRACSCFTEPLVGWRGVEVREQRTKSTAPNDNGA